MLRSGIGLFSRFSHKIRFQSFSDLGAGRGRSAGGKYCILCCLQLMKTLDVASGHAGRGGKRGEKRGCPVVRPRDTLPKTSDKAKVGSGEKGSR